MPSTLRYMAITSENPSRLADFYGSWLGLRDLERSSSGEVSLTDGWYNLAFLPHRDGGRPPGLSHIGVAVDDLEALRERLAQSGSDVSIQPDEGGPHRGEYQLTDPAGNVVSVSTSNFGVPDSGEHGYPSIRHAAIVSPMNDMLSEFFMDRLGLQQAAPRMWGWLGRFVTDGSTQLALLANADQLREHEREVTIDHIHEGLNHFGWEAHDVDGLLAKLPAGARSAQRVDRPNPKDYHRLWDLDGNHFDLRDAGAWDRETAAYA